ncbi:MAG: DUF4358 domain-containing protein [Ruminococcaceae bacterium]|nr:DUF4358 domain-containing protein [Oscillospiraceae bacterium]
MNKIKNNKYSAIELGCVAVLVVFVIILLAVNSGGTDKAVTDVAEPVIKAADVSKMTKKPAAFAAKTFSFDLAKTDGVVYYTNENIMDVSELLIVKVKDRQDAKEVARQIEKQVESQKNLFKNYAPDQYDLLGESVIKTSGNTVFYCTGKNADDAYAAFKKAL